ncbi:hypothetical protein BI334_21975 [Moorena producens 3L]|nr:hypothetical protein BI334_21975 [Moorena producens 3L]
MRKNWVHSQLLNSIENQVLRDYRGFEPRSTDIQPMHIMGNFFLRLPWFQGEDETVRSYRKIMEPLWLIGYAKKVKTY